MAAPKRTMAPRIHHSLRKHRGIKAELERLEKAANMHIRKTLPSFMYQPGEVADLFLDDLAQIVSRKDWRPPLERSADRLSRASKRIHEAVGLLVQTATGCPTYATIPTIVFESTPEADGERQRFAALSLEDKMKSAMERPKQSVIDPRTFAPDFLKAMFVYGMRCEHEAHRLKAILKSRNRHFDALGPMLALIHDVQSFTGKPHDHTIARLLTDAQDVTGSGKPFSGDAVRKIRERHLAS